MSIDINLISKPTSEGSKDLRLKKIKIATYATLFIVAALSLVLFLINLRFSVNYVKGQQAKIIESLSNQDKKAAKIFILDQRLSEIQSLLNERRKFHERTAELLKNNTESILVEEYEINDSGITLKFVSTSLLELNNLLNEIIKISNSNKISSVTLESLSLENSQYSVEIRIN